jgi:hypothetical protein
VGDFLEWVRSKPKFVFVYRMDLYEGLTPINYNDVDLEYQYKLTAVTVLFYCTCFIYCYCVPRRR